MSLRARARRLAAAVRLAVHGPPLLRLIRLLRRGQAQGREYVDLCLQLGLSARAATALQAAPAPRTHPSQPVRLAVLLGQAGDALAQARALLARLPEATLSGRELDAVVNTVAPLDAALALALLQAAGRPAAAEPALRLQLGDLAGAAAALQRLGAAAGPQRWLLQANLQADTAAKLAGLNHFLAEHGLAGVQLRDAGAPLSVAQLASSGATPAPVRRGKLLSVVMTCFDCAPYVDAAIGSVLAQTHAALELIVVDDASRDDTWARLQAAAAADARVRAVRLQRNVGTYAAKNVGLALARGDWLAFQDADDWSCPERFARCIALLQRRPWLQAVACEYVRLQDDGLFWSSLVWPLQRRTPNSIVFRRRVLERIGFFDEHRFGSDGEYVARLLASFGPRALHRLPQPLIIAARRANSLMTAPGTGLDASGRSQARADFQQAWTEALLQRALAGASHHRAAVDGTPALIEDRT